jgi:predicted nuclease with TOPRIM domain
MSKQDKTTAQKTLLLTVLSLKQKLCENSQAHQKAFQTYKAEVWNVSVAERTFQSVKESVSNYSEEITNMIYGFDTKKEILKKSIEADIENVDLDCVKALKELRAHYDGFADEMALFADHFEHLTNQRNSTLDEKLQDYSNTASMDELKFLSSQKFETQNRLTTLAKEAHTLKDEVDRLSKHFSEFLKPLQDLDITAENTKQELSAELSERKIRINIAIVTFQNEVDNFRAAFTADPNKNNLDNI